MAIMHDEIDNWVAADLHGELSESEQSVLHAHLIECAACRKTHQETKTMNKILEEKFTAEKPDATFEQRMLADFRSRVPEKRGLAESLADLVRVRAVQITAIAAVLLGLVQIGRIITGENARALRDREDVAAVELAASPSQDAAAEALRAGALDKSDAFVDRRQKDMPLRPPRHRPCLRVHGSLKTQGQAPRQLLERRPPNLRPPRAQRSHQVLRISRARKWLRPSNRKRPLQNWPIAN